MLHRSRTLWRNPCSAVWFDAWDLMPALYRDLWKPTPYCALPRPSLTSGILLLLFLASRRPVFSHVADPLTTFNLNLY